MTGLPRSLLLLIGSLILFWGIVIYQLGAQWSVYEQYHYGWGVPLLMLYLLRERWPDRPPLAPSAMRRPEWLMVVAFFLWLPARWLHEANPTWRFTSLVLTLACLVATLSFLFAAGGRGWLKHFWFPFAFFLIAVPWPSSIEGLMVQNFTRANSLIVSESLRFFGIPAVLQGNIIQLPTGLVGVEDACSGINSFQTTVMITLFLGDLHRLSPWRRTFLTGGGVLLAFLLNIFRTFLLVWISAKQGTETMEKWHDYAGWGILIVVFVTLLWICKRLTGPRDSYARFPTGEVSWPSVPARWGVGLLLVLVATEIGTKAWYVSHEIMLTTSSTAWKVSLPPALITGDKPLMERARREFRCDRGEGYEWQDPSGYRWQVFYFEWNSSGSLFQRTRVQLSKSHRPEICLPNSGISFRERLPTREVSLGELVLPVVPYLFEQGKTQVYVYFSVWEEGMRSGMAANMREDSRQRVRAALQGVRSHGQRLVEITLIGPKTQAEADQAFRERLRTMIQVADGA
jgi:exosortase